MNAAIHKKESPAEKKERGALLGQLEHAIAQTELEYTIEAIHVRADTITVVLEEMLHTCPPPGWEINERSAAATETRESRRENAPFDLAGG